jgi:uncharacterized membrane protein
MKKTVKIIFTFIAAFVLVAFLILVINQTALLVNFASNINPYFGQILLAVLIVFYVVCILVPVILYLKMPKALQPPERAEGLEYDRFMEMLRKRLSANKHLKDNRPKNKEDVDRALKILSKEADSLSSQSAKHVFIATAISQNGRLDGLIVLAVQTRLVWQIAHTYYQRPSLREMMKLYINVLMTAFVAIELQDMDISDQMEPLMSSVLGSAVGVIPGARAVSSVLIDSSLTGAANAFLTLRVGMITKKYCGSTLQEKRGVMRRSASAEAAKVLGSVVSEGMKKVAFGVAKATGNKMTSPFTSVYGHAKKSVSGLVKRKSKKDSTEK